jgi:hypothetical protein
MSSVSEGVLILASGSGKEPERKTKAFTKFVHERGNIYDKGSIY